jgi:uncharacterized protein GlcG (DUF336 family)
MNIAVVDAGGNLVTHVRQDGSGSAASTSRLARPGHCRAFDIPTQDLSANAQPTLQFFGIHTTNNGDVAKLAGGIPLVRDDVVVGAIGVSGGSGEQAHSVAEAGAAAP